MTQEVLEVSAMTTNGLIQLRQLFELIENILKLRGRELLVVGQVFQPHVLRA